MTNFLQESHENSCYEKKIFGPGSELNETSTSVLISYSEFNCLTIIRLPRKLFQNKIYPHKTINRNLNHLN